jgi:hypothetical protein
MSPEPSPDPVDAFLADCAVCGRRRLLVAPPCAEGHGADCPDRICAECGTAVFLDPVVVAPGAAAGRRHPRVA